MDKAKNTKKPLQEENHEQEFRLVDLILIEILQKLQDGFAKSYHIPTIIYGHNGAPITKPSQFTKFHKLVYSTEKGKANCEKFHAKLIKNVAKERKTSISKGGTLSNVITCAIPIMVEGKHLANFSIGQMIEGAFNSDEIKKYAQEIKVDEKKLIEAAKTLRPTDNKSFKATVNFVNTLAETIGSLAAEKLKQDRSLNKCEQKQKDLKTTNLQQLENEHAHHLIMETSLQGVARVNKEGEIVFANSAISTLTGYSFPELKKMSIDTLFPSGETKAISDANIALLVSGKTIKGENKLTHQDGKQREAYFSCAPLFNEKGDYDGFVASIMDISKRKQAKEEQLENEEKYRTLVANIPGAAYRCDYKKNWTMRFLSNQIEELSGYPATDFISDHVRSYASIIHIDDRKKVENMVFSAVENKEPFQIEYRINHANGETRWIYENGKAVFDENDNASCLDGVLIDITERKQAEEELQTQAKFIDNLIENSALSTWVSDAEGTAIRANPACLDFFGATNEEVVGKYNLFKDEVLIKQGFIPKLRKVFEKGEVVDVIIDYNFGEIEHVSIKNATHKIIKSVFTPLLDKNNKVINAICQTMDLTDVKQAEKALQASESKYKDIFTNTLSAIYTFNNKKEFIDTNPAGEKLLGYSKEELLKLSITDVDADIEVVKPAHKNLSEGGNLLNFEHKLVRKDGRVITVLNNSIPIQNKLGKAIGMQSFLLDISEIKRKEQELKSALEKARESDRLKSAFLSNMSHEIRTPMNGILGFTGLLKDPQLSGDEQHRYLEIIERSGHRMLSTINDIIDISRIEAGQVEVVKMEISINKLLDEQYDFFNPEAESKGLELIYYPTLSAGEAFIITDKHKLEGILSNLIKNALKFTKHGKVTFGCALVNNSTELEIFVTDTGIGIPQSRLEAIFNRFEQADIEDSNVYEGSGLGLTISKSYVEMLGGNIRVSSKEAYGSSFKFTIPYLKKIQKEQKVDAAKKDQKIALKKLSIIVAEDDKPSKFFFKEIFMHTFEELIFTSSGRETIDLCKENPEIDFILMDIKMPNINGYDATREIRKFNNKVIIIAQTAFAMSGDKEKAIDAGCNDYITKPIDRNSLLERLLYHSNKGR